MEMAHTKGEWIAKKGKIDNFIVMSESDKQDDNGKRLVIASCFYEKAWKDPYLSGMGRPQSKVRRTPKTAEANAKLIAQAPKLLKRSIDLLDSILSIHQYNKDVCTERDIKRIEKMQEAIKKATK